MNQPTDGLSSAARGADLLVVVFSRIARHFKQVSTDADLTPTQNSVLARLAKDGPLTTGELAALERVRSQSMTAVVADLERRGLVERGTDPADGRRRPLSISPTAQDFVDHARQARRAWLVAAFEERLSEPERLAVLDALALLDRMVEP